MSFLPLFLSRPPSVAWFSSRTADDRALEEDRAAGGSRGKKNGNLRRTFDGDVAAIVVKAFSIEKHNRGLFAERAEKRVSRSPVSFSHSRAETAAEE